jgi:DNA-binding CsgD family transcriptional regulator
LRASGIDRDELSKVMTRLGEAVVNPSAWPEIMDAICRAAGATGAVLLQSDVRTPDVPRTESFNEPVQLYFGNNWHLSDSRAKGIPRVIAGEVVTDQDLLTPEEIRSDPMYNEVLRPFGYQWFAGVGFWADAAPWILTIQRTRYEGPFEARDKRLLARLAPRLTETATLSSAVGRANLSCMTNVLNQLRQPALILDRRGLVIERNAAADAGFDAEIRIKDRQLVVGDTTARARLDQLVRQLRSAPETAALSTEPILIRRKRKPPVVLRVLPIDGAASSVFLGARAMCILSNLVPQSGPEPALISQAFGITTAEARFVSLFASGMSVADVAERLGITRETARKHLKSVFSKTDTHRQSELISLVARLG